MAMLFAALLVLGVTPGPQLLEERPDLFWGVVNSMYIGNILLLILSIPLVGIFVRILRVRPAILAPITALITVLGAYTINNSVFDVFVMIAFGIIGYLMKKTGFEPGPMVLAFVLGAILEDSVRRSLLIFDGDPTGFATRPISGTILAVFVIVWCCPRSARSSAVARRTAPAARRPTSPTERTPCDDHPDRLRPTPVGEAALDAGLAEAAARGDDVVILNSPRRGSTVDVDLVDETSPTGCSPGPTAAGVDRPGRPCRPRRRPRRRRSRRWCGRHGRPADRDRAAPTHARSASWCSAATPSGSCSRPACPVLAVKPPA